MCVGLSTTGAPVEPSARISRRVAVHYNVEELRVDCECCGYDDPQKCMKLVERPIQPLVALALVLIVVLKLVRRESERFGLHRIVLFALTRHSCHRPLS